MKIFPELFILCYFAARLRSKLTYILHIFRRLQRPFGFVDHVYCGVYMAADFKPRRGSSRVIIRKLTRDIKPAVPDPFG